ncbi:hypothetical protein GTP56_15065 [Duganella sp. FT134W]|uniref:Uncharacterized protein n=1 Tax=Duganella margarita TaxID=2692170 RepID=A0A7X4H1D0_9BURK|nr:hypothetical protein [Duganella margarita]MYM73513.1 hypothetical protein [Duganella margarita]
MNQSVAIDQFRQFPSEDFAEDDPVRPAVSKIIDYLISAKPEHVCHLSFGMIQKVAGLEDSEEDHRTLYRTISYITGERTHLLELVFEYVMDDYAYILDEEEEADYRGTGSFSDPRTGEEVPDSAEHIHIYFKASRVVLQK